MRKTRKLSSLFKNYEDQFRCSKQVQNKKRNSITSLYLTLSNFLFSRKDGSNACYRLGKILAEQMLKQLHHSQAKTQPQVVGGWWCIVQVSLDWDLELEFDNIKHYQLLPDEIRLKSPKTKYIIKTFLTLISIRSFSLRCIFF